MDAPVKVAAVVGVLALIAVAVARGIGDQADVFHSLITFRAENSFLPLELRSSANPAEYGNIFAELKQCFDLGVDGVFTDNAEIAKAVRDDE